MPVICTNAYGQDNCSEVLRYAAKDELAEDQSYAFANRLYSNHCEGANYKENRNLNIGLDAVVESIPISFKLGSGSSLDKANHFCKTYQEHLSQNYTRAARASLVSSVAVQAWEACQRFRNLGVFFAPAIRSDRVTISVEKRGPNPVVIQGVAYDQDKLSCFVTGNDQDPTGAPKADQNTRRTLNTGDHWQVSCRRSGEKVGDEIRFRQATLSVLTTAGAFDLPIPADAEIGPQSAAAITEAINQLRLGLLDTSKRRLRCVTITKESGRKNTPGITADSSEHIRNGYVLTGGGCELYGPAPGYPNGRAHNGPTTHSMPTASRDGWYCQAMDPPGIPLDYEIRAYATFCRLD
ncbi:MAG: hypothetical protein HC850_16560 [Rhodomicrobium sp.]|nr:hypothetical protein [Rhodomicrobium sp.]